MKNKEYKKMLEKRVELQNQLEAITNKAVEEVRAMTEEEAEEFEKLEGEIRALDETISKAKKARDLAFKENAKAEGTEAEEEQRANDTEAFEGYIRTGNVGELRAGEFGTGDNGAVIPSTIANQIIEEVEDICPIWQMSEHYNLGGKLQLPYYDESTSKIEMAWMDEFDELTVSGAKFESIELSGFLAGALAKVSRSLLNNAAFPLTDFIVHQVAKAAARFIEAALLNGATGKVDGLSTAKQVVTAASATVITADDLIDLQEKVRDQFQAGAIWIMNRATRAAIRKLKDADGNYLLNRDLTTKWGYTLLGRPVYTSDNMPTIASGEKTVIYLDPTGLATKITEDVTIDVLREKFATQHAIGVVAWMEFDAKVKEEQKIAVLQMA